jgi:hypothetical protein
MLLKLYLAHSVELITTTRTWEVYIQGKYYIDLMNPFKNEHENLFVLKKLKTRRQILEYMETLSDSVKTKIVKADLKLLRQCDGLVGIFKEPSIGTAQEIFAAAYLYRIPVYVICGAYVSHPWITECARVSGGDVFRTKKEFEDHLVYLGLLKEV